MEIESKEITSEKNYLDPVTYVPPHACGNAAHKDCEQGVIIRISTGAELVHVLYCKGRTVQATKPEHLVWG